jgi:hypothetical protein
MLGIITKQISLLEPPCYSSPCKNKGICENDGDSFKCSCRPGYKGKICEELGKW